jgi:hypothetical protein
LAVQYYQESHGEYWYEYVTGRFFD